MGRPGELQRGIDWRSMNTWDMIYEDAAIMVVYKPAGLAVETSKVAEKDLVSELANYRKKAGEDPYVGVVSRLDQPVEGVLVFGKTSNVTNQLTVQMREKRLWKKYHVIVTREAMPKEGSMTDYLMKDSTRNRAKVVEEDHPRAKKAVLHYRRLQRLDGAALMEVTLDTGRFHQIRCQFAARTAPILGDVKYGGPSTGRALALAAVELNLQHPVSKEPLTFKINPKGEDFVDFL